MANTTRVSLPPDAARQLKILSAHREIAGNDLVIELIAREYATLGLAEPKLDWKAPEATSDYERPARQEALP